MGRIGKGARVKRSSAGKKFYSRRESATKLIGRLNMVPRLCLPRNSTDSVDIVNTRFPFVLFAKLGAKLISPLPFSHFFFLFLSIFLSTTLPPLFLTYLFFFTSHFLTLSSFHSLTLILFFSLFQALSSVRYKNITSFCLIAQNIYTLPLRALSYETKFPSHAAISRFMTRYISHVEFIKPIISSEENVL